MNQEPRSTVLSYAQVGSKAPRSGARWVLVIGVGLGLLLAGIVFLETYRVRVLCLDLIAPRGASADGLRSAYAASTSKTNMQMLLQSTKTSQELSCDEMSRYLRVVYHDEALVITLILDPGRCSARKYEAIEKLGLALRADIERRLRQDE